MPSWSLAVNVLIAVAMGAIIASTIQATIYARRRERRDRLFHDEVMRRLRAGERVVSQIIVDELEKLPPVN